MAWFRRWRFVLFVLFLAVFAGPGVIAHIGSNSSVWDWTTAGCLVLLVVGLPLFIRDALRGDRPTTPRTDPTDVPDAAVRQAVSTAGDRVSAIRVLREAHPGLALRDAAALVDAHRRS